MCGVLGCGTTGDSPSGNGIILSSEGSSVTPSVGVVEVPAIVGMEAIPMFVLVTDIALVEDTAFLLRYGRTTDHRVGIIRAGEKESVAYPFPDSGTVALIEHKDMLEVTFPLPTPDGQYSITTDYDIQGGKYTILATHQSIAAPTSQ